MAADFFSAVAVGAVMGAFVFFGRNQRRELRVSPAVDKG
jgi:hypothetical protein